MRPKRERLLAGSNGLISVAQIKMGNRQIMPGSAVIRSQTCQLREGRFSTYPIPLGKVQSAESLLAHEVVRELCGGLRDCGASRVKFSLNFMKLGL